MCMCAVRTYPEKGCTKNGRGCALFFLGLEGRSGPGGAGGRYGRSVGSAREGPFLREQFKLRKQSL